MDKDREDFISFTEKYKQYLDSVALYKEDIDKRDKMLSSFEFRLNERDQDLKHREELIEKDLLSISEQKEYIYQKRKEVEKKEEDIDKEWQNLFAKQKELDEIDKKKSELFAIQLKTDKKIKDLNSLLKDKERIEGLKSLVEKEKILNRDRKAELDIREDILNKEQKRLQKIATQFKTS